MSIGGDEQAKQLLCKKYQSMLYRVAFSNLRNRADAEDAVQETFLRYFKGNQEFESEEHAKAWFLRVTLNICHDMTRSAWMQKIVSIEELPEWKQDFQVPYVEMDETLWQVLELPITYRNPLYLFYYEDYSIREIGEILGMQENTVKTRLRRGRELLKEKLRKEGKKHEN